MAAREPEITSLPLVPIVSLPRTITTMPNGTKRVEKLPRKDSHFRMPLKNIAAIDFGTKFCSLAFLTENDTVDLLNGVPKLPLNGNHVRVPTAILFNECGEVEYFGFDAQSQFWSLPEDKLKTHFFFEEVKMNLQRDEDVNREMKVKPVNSDKEFFLVDVIAQFLKYLKNEFIEKHLKLHGHSFSATDFDWVITVPAIWKARGKQMMREAGYKAGLICRETSGGLQVASSQLPTDYSPDKLSLALEPESAAIYCHEMLKRNLVSHQLRDSVINCGTPRSYLIVDIGGGTVDISAHRAIASSDESEVNIEEMHHSVGNDCGGRRVNQEFQKFLGHLVGDPDFIRFVKTCDPEANNRNQRDLSQLVNDAFENKKQIFCRSERRNRKEVVIRLPHTMFEIYKDDLTKEIQQLGSNALVKLVRQDLRISPEKMEEILKPAVDGILKCTSALLTELESPPRQDSIDVIYLVGGFGGCRYIYEKMREKFGDQCIIVVPRNPEYAVVEGAVLFRQNPSVVRARKTDATYGTDVVLRFNHSIHDRRRRKIDDDSIPRCHDIFKTIVGTGETVSPDYVYTYTGTPIKHNQTNMCIGMYCSTEKPENIWYVNGEKCGGAVKIGKLTVDMPDPTGDKLREVEFTFDFSHTEIQIKGYDKTSGTEVKTVVDFLSAHI